MTSSAMPEFPQENPSSTMPQTSETAKQNPTASEASQTAPSTAEPLYSFYCKIEKAGKLQNALAALCDSGFQTKHPVAAIDVNEDGLQITYNRGHIASSIRLLGKGMMKFQCREPVMKKIVNLSDISLFLGGADKDDVVTIFLVKGSTDLSFEYGKDDAAPAGELSMHIRYSAPELFKMIAPNIKSVAEAILHSQDLRDVMVRAKEEAGFSFNSSKGFFEIEIGQDSAVLWIGNQECFAIESRGTQGLQFPVSREFYLPFPDTLRKASYLCAKFSVSLMRDYYKSTLLRFNLGEDLGDLAYLVPN